MGEVFTYFEHVYNNERRFLAIVNVMKEHRFGEYYIPQVVEDPSRYHFAVLNIANIIQCLYNTQSLLFRQGYDIIIPNGIQGTREIQRTRSTSRFVGLCSKVLAFAVRTS